MSITIKSVTTQTVAGTGASVTVTTPTASVGDLLLIILSNDYYLLSDMSLTSITPTATSTEITNFDCAGGTNKPNIKAWWAPVTTAGAATVVASTGHPDEEKAMAVYVLSGVDTANPIDAAANSGAMTTAQNPVAPTVSPTNATDLLICHVQTDGTGNSVTFTAPGSMTSQYNVTDGTFMRTLGATQQLSASGSTGTRTWTASASCGWVASSVAIKAAPPTAAFVQGNATGDSTNNTTTTCAFTSNVTAGNLANPGRPIRRVDSVVGTGAANDHIFGRFRKPRLA